MLRCYGYGQRPFKIDPKTYAEDTMSQTPRKLPKTAFQPGCAPGPGRPKGAQSVDRDCDRCVVRGLRAVWPRNYSAGSREISADLSDCCHFAFAEAAQVEKISPLQELTNQELAMLEEMLAAGRAKLIEQHKGASAALGPADTKHPDKP